MIFMNLQEWIKIGILHQVKEYPFGGEGPVPYYYKNAKLYSLVMFVWGVLYSINMTFGIISITKNRVKLTYLSLSILVTLFIGQFLHGLIY